MNADSKIELPFSYIQEASHHQGLAPRVGMQECNFLFRLATFPLVISVDANTESGISKIKQVKT